MHIAFDVRVLKNRYKTGVEEYTTQLLAHLLKIDTRNRYTLFYTHSFSIGNKLDAFCGDRVSVRHLRTSNKLMSLLWKFPGLPPIDWLLPRDVDVFFSPHINILPTSRGKKITVVHDIAFLRHPECFTLWKLWWHRYMASTSLPDSDIIIAVSHHTKEELVALCNIPEEKICVVHSGVPVPTTHAAFSQEEREKFRARVGLPERFFLCLGTLEPRKNIERVIRAFARFARSPQGGGVFLVIAGKRGWKYEGIFRTLREEGVEHLVTYHAYLSDEDKRGYLACATALLYPSLYEGFGFPPLEAFAAGLPVLCANTSSLPEVVGAAACLVDPYSIDEIQQGMSVLAGDEGVRRELVKRGFDQVREFRWERTAEEVLRILEGL